MFEPVFVEIQRYVHLSYLCQEDRTVSLMMEQAGSDVCSEVVCGAQPLSLGYLGASWTPTSHLADRYQMSNGILPISILPRTYTYSTLTT